MPLISVIVPVYKVEPYIHRCVDSILGQSYTDFELILVDDGSPDNCGVICDDYARQDSRIHVIHQNNGGLSAARNAGIDWAFANSDSKWLTFIDSDDWVHREYLDILMRSAMRFDAGISACGLLHTEGMVEDAEISWEELHCVDAQMAYTDYYIMCMTACCKIYRKELFRNIRFPVGKLHEDCYITHILLFQAEQVAVCDEALYYYYSNPGSITRVKWDARRLQEIEAHEIRVIWLKEHGYEAAYRWEVEVTINTIYEHTEILAKRCKEDGTYAAYLQNLRKTLRGKLNDARKMDICPLTRERLWLYLMAYPALPVWRFGQWLRGLRDKKK